MERPKVSKDTADKIELYQYDRYKEYRHIIKSLTNYIGTLRNRIWELQNSDNKYQVPNFNLVIPNTRENIKIISIKGTENRLLLEIKATFKPASFRFVLDDTEVMILRENFTDTIKRVLSCIEGKEVIYRISIQAKSEKHFVVRGLTTNISTPHTSHSSNCLGDIPFIASKSSAGAKMEADSLDFNMIYNIIERTENIYIDSLLHSEFVYDDEVERHMGSYFYKLLGAVTGEERNYYKSHNALDPNTGNTW